MENNNKFQFKTTINCGGCIKAVTPFLNKVEGIEDWSVDTDNPDKVLTVHSSGASEEEIVATLEKAGFKAQPIL